MPGLYELSTGYVECWFALEDCSTPEEYDQALNAFFSVQADLVTKAENCAKARIMLNASAKAKREEAKRLLESARRDESSSENIKNHVHFCLESAGLVEVKTPIGKWKIAKNPPSVEITDEAAIPEEYLIPQPSKVDKDKILDDFKAYGMAVPGVEIVQKESVRFK